MTKRIAWTKREEETFKGGLSYEWCNALRKCVHYPDVFIALCSSRKERFELSMSDLETDVLPLKLFSHTRNTHHDKPYVFYESLFQRIHFS